jgi:predicted deacetylase
VPSLLVSLHDVSPLTLGPSAEAVRMITAAGVPASALTVLVVPYHEGKVRLDQHEPTQAFLKDLADRGANLVMHGYTHRMAERAGFFGWPLAHGFARGQGELYRASVAEAQRRLDAGKEILASAGLEVANEAFVPPAWLLSPAAAEAVVAAGFRFHERFGGVVAAGQMVARRLIGWGALNALEAWATSVWAGLVALRAPADTRLAVHPPDVTRARTRASVERALRRLGPALHAQTYRDYLASQRLLS